MTLLQNGDPEPAAVQRAGARAPFLIICDHAGRLTPRTLGDMGVSAADWLRHIAWDIGALALANRLGERFDACVISQRYSRLVIDCNRDPARVDAIPQVSDATPIPANRGLTPEGRAARVAEVHAPYHGAVASELDVRAARGEATRLLFVHSFTPQLAGGPLRPWRFGVLHLPGSAFSRAMIEVLRETPGEEVGDNQPYAMDAIDYSAPTHAIARGLDYLELEVRQDLITDAAGVEAIAAHLAPRILKAADRAGNGSV